MGVNLPELWINVQTAAEHIHFAVATWLNYTVRWISTFSPHVEGTFRSIAAVIGLNLAFFEVALLIHKGINATCNFCYPYEELSDRGMAARRGVLGCTFILMIGGANHAFRQMLNIRIPVWAHACIGLATQATWLVLRTEIGCQEMS